MERTIHISRTNPQHSDFRNLTNLLNHRLSENNGEQDEFYAQFNTIDTIKHVLVAYIDGKAVGCGAIKEFEADTAEVKRMFVDPQFRRQGIAKSILEGLEQWAAELNYKRCILETGKRMTDAVLLYQNTGYEVIPNYGQYAGVEDSVCMQKTL